nr:unnamed protein product [Haemonchus contortus]
MHLHTITAIYFTLLFAQGQAKEQECRSNVTAILLEVLNEKCSNITEAYQLPTTYKPLKDENYDCTLERKAKKGKPSDPYAVYFFDGRSSLVLPNHFLNGALSRRVTIMCGLLITKIGCYIETTELKKGHELLLRCNYGLS